MRKRLLALAITAALVSIAEAQQTPDPRVVDIVRAGKIRIGVFLGAQYSKDAKTGEPKGLAIDIARALAARMGVAEVLPVESNPAAVVACLQSGGCDLASIGIVPARTTEVDFTPPFIKRDFTYLVPAGSSIRRAADADRPGVRIAAVRGHASTTELVRVIKQASLVYAEDLDLAVDLLRTGGADAFASVREVVLQYSTKLPELRVLEDGYDINIVGIAIQKGHPGRLAYISEFLDDLKRSGWLRKAIDRAGLRGFEVATQKATK